MWGGVWYHWDVEVKAAADSGADIHEADTVGHQVDGVNLAHAGVTVHV